MLLNPYNVRRQRVVTRSWYGQSTVEARLLVDQIIDSDANWGEPFLSFKESWNVGKDVIATCCVIW